MSYLENMEPMGSVIATDLDIAVYDMDSQIYQVFLTEHLALLSGTSVDNGGIAIGSYSPSSVITLDEHTRKIANIPDDAVYFAWAYPISGLNDVPVMIKRKMITTIPAVSFALFGGFLFFSDNKTLLQANGIFGGNNISFDSPKEISYTDVFSTLSGSGRLQDVTSQELIDMNIDKYCWILPNEIIGVNTIAPYGGFLYIYKDKFVQYFEIIKAHPEQEYNPFIENKTPFSTIQNCIKYLETEFNESLESISETEIITKLTEHCKQLRDKVDELQDVFACKQCMSNPQDVAFNCGHMLCYQCSKNKHIGTECPICRDPIESKLNLYYS